MKTETTIREETLIGLIRAPAAADMMGIPIQRLYSLVRNGKLPRGLFVRFGERQIRFNAEEIVRFCNEGGTGPEETRNEQG